MIVVGDRVLPHRGRGAEKLGTRALFLLPYGVGCCSRREDQVCAGVSTTTAHRASQKAAQFRPCVSAVRFGCASCSKHHNDESRLEWEPENVSLCALPWE